MALKPNRVELPDGSRIKYFCLEEAERGVVVLLDANGGEGMDDPDATVSLPTGTGGVAAGVLMNDVVDKDLTRQRLNWHKDEVQLGNKVAIMTRGMISTNMIKSGDAPVAGGPAHWEDNGEFTTTTTSDQVGRFVSGVDSDGYVEIEININ